MTRLNELLKRYPGRKCQIERLHCLYGGRNTDEPFADGVFVHGGPGVGKTTIVAALLDALNIRHALLNLIECYTPRILFELVLNKLNKHKLDPVDGQPFCKCDGMLEFINCLKKSALDNFVIVLDNAEKLQQMDFNILPCFMRLRELTDLNVSVIFISEVTFENYYKNNAVIEPIKIHFKQYNKDEILEILTLDYKYAKDSLLNNYSEELDIDIDFYKNYLNVFLSVFYRACRDLSELQYMARINFIKYCQPIYKKECKLTDSMVLWRHISPILKSSLEVLYLRLSSGSDHKELNDYSNLPQSLELPFYAKYLLIAAYLASYNPAKDDKRIFMKFHGKKRKTVRDMKAKSKVSEQLTTQLGPKPFSFDRLLAIFYAILNDKVGFNNNLLVQVSSLVQLQLLTALSDNYNLDGQKYKCTVNFEFIQAISKMVGFNIRKYLSDFSHM